jgi:hypothetical protein
MLIACKHCQAPSRIARSGVRRAAAGIRDVRILVTAAGWQALLALPALYAAFSHRLR